MGFISNVATLPHARGRGFARAVMTQLVRWLDEDTGAERIDLAATEEGAVIYRSMGFTESAFPTMRRPGVERPGERTAYEEMDVCMP